MTALAAGHGFAGADIVPLAAIDIIAAMTPYQVVIPSAAFEVIVPPIAEQLVVA